jgi:Photosynthetic reaction centre cytochrome C subunit
MCREIRASYPYTLAMKLGRLLVFALTIITTGTTRTLAQAPTPTVVESPNVKILTGLYAQQFQEEMNLMVQALGVTCNTCHVPRNFASEDKPLKQTARQMLEMTRALNKQYFPDHKPKDGESVLGRVTCYTCHKGEQLPKTAVGQ